MNSAARSSSAVATAPNPTLSIDHLLTSIRTLFSRASGTWFGLDLGTANTLVVAKELGIVLNEPTVVAIRRGEQQLASWGREAKQLLGEYRQQLSDPDRSASSLRVWRPMRDGVIADYEATTLFLHEVLTRAGARGRWWGPHLVVGVPASITQVEKRATLDALHASGARRVRLIEEPMAAALGAGIDVTRLQGNMVIDIGGGTTEVAVIANGGTVYSHSIRVAGDEMDEVIQRYLRRERQLEVGPLEAERIKLLLGSALAGPTTRECRAYGTSTVTGRPHEITVHDGEIREALNEPLEAIIASVHAALHHLSPELALDISMRGALMSGGGSLIRGLPDRLTQELSVKFYRVQDPLTAVARGLGVAAASLELGRQLCIAEG